MSSRGRDARIVVIRMWREPADEIRLRIVDRADQPPALRQTVVAASVDAGLDAIGRILRAFAAPAGRPGDRG